MAIGSDRGVAAGCAQLAGSAVAYVETARMSRAERRWVLGFAAAAMLFTSLPYAIAFLAQPHTFTGFLIGVEDGNAYIAQMMQGAAGEWLFRSVYSTLPQQGALLYLPYLLLGKLLGTHASHLAFALVFHALRLASLLALCYAVYVFLSEFVSNVSLRRLGSVLAVLGSGLGWLVLLSGHSELFGSLPLDFYSPETFGFLAAFSLPHLVLSRALLLYVLVCVLRDKAAGWRFALLWFALALVHLLTAALGLVLLALYVGVAWLRRAPGWRAARGAGLWALAGAALPLAYNAWVYLNDAYLQGWAAQNLILAPHPLHYVLAYGWLLPFVYLGWRSQVLPAAARTLSACWLLALPVLLYLPVGLQRRFAEGAWVLLLALALHGLERMPVLRVRRLAAGLVLLAAPSTLLLWLGALNAALYPAAPAFRTADEVAVFSSLREHPGATVLAAYSSGNALPAWAPVRVVIGHGPETVGLGELSMQVQAFYHRDTPEVERIAFLRQHGVEFVLWGPAEREHSQGWTPELAEYLLPYNVYGDLQLFRVRAEQLPLE
ncbi:MAG: hypothetical protein KIS88_01980 [Anaerolineales bacterium]|nr:hypothetical protein [Anaerolineales bacterium]